MQFAWHSQGMVVSLRQLTLVVSCLLAAASGVVAKGAEPAGRLRVVAGDEERATATSDTDDARRSSGLSEAAVTAVDRLVELDGQWQSLAEPLVRRADAAGASQLATEVGQWSLAATPPGDGRQTVHRIPASVPQPDWYAGASPVQQAVWRDYQAARHTWADAVYAAARDAAQAEQGCEAFRLLAVALAADPDHEQARDAGGWVKRVEDGITTWLWPEAARRASRREVYSPEYGWLPKTWQARYADGKRRAGSRWVSRDDVPPPKTPADAPVWQADHWRISYLGDEADAAELAARLEETHAIWWQVFGSFAMERGELQRRFSGQARPQSGTAMQAVRFASRQQYIDTLERLEPQIGRTLGIYWTPTQTSYFFKADDADPTTIFHEATHQLFAESRRTSRLAGEQHGFWVLEAIACYMESLEPTETGWRLGGLEHGRAPVAVERLTLDGFYVPLEELCGLGRVAFQARPDLPQLYSQISGLADFFINAEQGRYREAFVTCLQRVYTGAARPDSLARLCDAEFEELDAAYRRYVSR